MMRLYFIFIALKTRYKGGQNFRKNNHLKVKTPAK